MTTLYYWTWLVIYIIRTLMNLNVFIKRGDAAMEPFINCGKINLKPTYLQILLLDLKLKEKPI